MWRSHEPMAAISSVDSFDVGQRQRVDTLVDAQPLQKGSQGSGEGGRSVVAESRPRTGLVQLGGNAQGDPAKRASSPDLRQECMDALQHPRRLAIQLGEREAAELIADAWDILNRGAS